MDLHESLNNVHIVRVIDDLSKASNHNHFPLLKVKLDEIISSLLLLVYDRTWVDETRYLTLRDYYERWNEDRELKYLDMVKDGRGRVLFDDKILMDIITREIFEDDKDSGLCLAHLNWPEAEREICVFYRVKNLFNEAFKSFKVLADIQGQYVPRLHAHWYIKAHDYDHEMLQHPCLLMEDVYGFKLVDLFTNAPERAWCDIGDKVLEVVNLISDRGVLNMWYTLNSFTIRTLTAEDGTVTYIPVMTDVKNCRTRRQDETDEQWRRAKRILDEEGQVGLQLVTMFKNAGHEYTYKPSFRYHRLKPEITNHRLVKYKPHLNWFQESGFRMRERDGGYTLDCPYSEGSTIELIVTNSISHFTPTLTKIIAKVVKLFQPVTVSPVMLVEVEGENSTMVLKLYDRRCCPKLRDDIPYDWNEVAENDYKSFVESGEADKFKPGCMHSPRPGHPGWLITQYEKWLHDRCSKLYASEVKAYDLLRQMQGKNIPKLFATVTLQYDSSSQNKYQHYFEAPGILMEYIQGINLMDICDHLDSSLWVSIVESATSLVGRMGDLNFINYDVHPSHVFVREVKYQNKSHYEPVMIDFAISRIRGANESDEDWYEDKLDWDEENVIGQIMSNIFRIKGHDWRHKDIRRYFMDDNGVVHIINDCTNNDRNVY